MKEIKRIKKRLQDTAKDIGKEGHDDASGSGLVNVKKFLGISEEAEITENKASEMASLSLLIFILIIVIISIYNLWN